MASDDDKRHGLGRGLTNYGDPDFSLYLRRSFARAMGYSREMLERPIVGIVDTASGFNNCHRHMPELVDAVKRGVLAAGGLPMVFPTISLGEVFLNPTSLMFRNLMSMDTEEMIRAQPMDAVVLIGGCDKTVPALLMGAASADIPSIMLVTGPSPVHAMPCSVEEVVGDGGQGSKQRSGLRCPATSTRLHGCLGIRLGLFPGGGAFPSGKLEAIAVCVHVVDLGLQTARARLAIRRRHARHTDCQLSGKALAGASTGAREGACFGGGDAG